jgi:hypothetical protein
MPYDRKPGDLILFPNDRRKSDREPVLKGTILMPTGEEWEIGIWKKQGNKGPFYTGQAKPKSAHPMQQRHYGPVDDDDIF